MCTLQRVLKESLFIIIWDMKQSLSCPRESLQLLYFTEYMQVSHQGLRVVLEASEQVRLVAIKQLETNDFKPFPSHATPVQAWNTRTCKLHSWRQTTSNHSHLTPPQSRPGTQGLVNYTVGDKRLQTIPV